MRNESKGSKNSVLKRMQLHRDFR